MRQGRADSPNRTAMKDAVIASPEAAPGIPLDIDLGPARSIAHAFDGDPTGPALLIVPALGVPARSYLRIGAALSERGFNALVMDLRGVGGSSVRARRGVDWGYLDLVDTDMRSLHQLGRTRWPSAPLHWLGHSLGGHLALLHQARHPGQPVGRVLLVASGSPWYRNFPWPHRWLVRSFGSMARSSSRHLGVFRGDWVRFGGPQGARLMQEWGDFCQRGRLGRLGPEGWDADAALASLNRPILGFSMGGDTYAPTPSTEHLASLTAGSLLLDHIPHLGDGKRPGHFLWMRHPEPVAEAIVRRL